MSRDGAEFDAAGHLVRLRVTIPGRVGDAKINGRFDPVIRRKGGKMVPSLKRSAKYNDWQNRAKLAIRAVARGRSFPPGPLVASIVTYWPTMHRKGPAAGLPEGDFDATIKAPPDACELAAALPNDAQIVRATVSKEYDRKNPRIEIEVWRA